MGKWLPSKPKKRKMSKLLFTEGGNNIQKDNLPTGKLQKKKVFRSTPVTTLVRPFNLNKQQKKRKKKKQYWKGTRGTRRESQGKSKGIHFE